MTASSAKAPKKEKIKKQTPEERQAALRYNHMMYGPTAGEFRAPAKKVNYGAAYLDHPKFQGLMAAFKKGTAFKFEVTAKDKTLTIATDGEHITFDGKTVFYSRPSNRHEDHLLLDRVTLVQYQAADALVHLVFAVLRTFPELASHTLSYRHGQFFWDIETLEAGIVEHGPNLLIGSFKRV